MDLDSFPDPASREDGPTEQRPAAPRTEMPQSSSCCLISSLCNGHESVPVSCSCCRENQLEGVLIPFKKMMYVETIFSWIFN